jgi:hypothetical protein
MHEPRRDHAARDSFDDCAAFLAALAKDEIYRLLAAAGQKVIFNRQFDLHNQFMLRG